MTTSLAVVKSLSLQLLEKNIGDEALFHALVKAHDLSQSNETTVAKLEEALWAALDIGLDQFAGKGKDHLVIVIDGLNELKNHDSIRSVMERLGLFTSKHGRLQAITLSRSSSHKPSKGKFLEFEIKPDFTHDDLQHVAEHAFHGYVHYKDQGEHARESIIEQLVESARGDFLWLLLTIYLLRKESSHEAFMKHLKAIKETRHSLHQTIGRITESIDLSRSDAYLILSWMLVAKRPLTFSEIKCLLHIDFQKKHIVERKMDIKSDLHAALGPLVIFQTEFVRLRHPAIREYLEGLQLNGTTKLLKPQVAQAELTKRLLAYCQFDLHRHQEPSLEPITKKDVNELFSKHALLEYAIRNWTGHFHVSEMYAGGSLQLSADLKAVFPSSTLVAMLEWACWSPQAVGKETYELALRVREAVFTEKHECVLQSLIICGTFYRTLSKIPEAGASFYRAWRIGHTVLHKYHILIVNCATSFLTIVETITTTTRIELTTRKEETLKYIIDVYKHQHGETHELVIKYYKMLAQLYVEIHEEHKAEAVWRELREIMVCRFGKGSEVRKSTSVLLLPASNRHYDISCPVSPLLTIHP